MNAKAFLYAVSLALIATPVVAEEIYRWIDDKGQTNYSDVPRDGAERIQVDPASTFSLPRASGSASRAESSTKQMAAGYEVLAILSPSAEETIWNTGGLITVTVRPTPSLQPGHSVSLYLNGTLIKDKAPQALTAKLSEVPRGEHKITADIRDQNNRSLIAAEPVVFFYRQTAAQNLQNLGDQPLQQALQLQNQVIPPNRQNIRNQAPNRIAR